MKLSYPTPSRGIAITGKLSDFSTRPFANGRFWPHSDGLASTVAMHGQTSVCSAISKASSTSIPKYLTVLSSLVWPRRSWTALRFFVLR